MTALVNLAGDSENARIVCACEGVTTMISGEETPHAVDLFFRRLGPFVSFPFPLGCSSLSLVTRQLVSVPTYTS